MKLFLLFLLAAVWIITTCEKCATVTQEDCDTMTSEYEKYRACMERRTKRSVDCYEDECDKCDCDSCNYNSCNNNCNGNCCTQCCQRSSCTTSNCCQQTCRAECRSNSCRTACKKKCQDKPTDIHAPPEVTQTKTGNQHNITTVIHLNNIINNTNLINLPINLNNTVLNNITTGERSLPDRVITGDGPKENCCLTIGPRQCVPQSSFPFVRCFHVRRRVCGSICSAPVVHYQTHEICDNEVNQQQPCRQQVVYIPQPQPRCAYQQGWPYVSCGNQGFQTCDGCYSHYVKREDVTKCSNFCYDDGYGIGPYYRQGPFYRPGFAHVPSCYQTGLCDTFDGIGYGSGYGYEGLPEYGFPPIYPPQTYPFIIEDCKNCTLPWDSPNSQEPMHQLNYKNLPSSGYSNTIPDKIINIDANVDSARSERYAEIRIKTTKKNKITTVSSAVTTEKSNKNS